MEDPKGIWTPKCKLSSSIQDHVPACARYHTFHAGRTQQQTLSEWQPQSLLGFIGINTTNTHPSGTSKLPKHWKSMQCHVSSSYLTNQMMSVPPFLLSVITTKVFQFACSAPPAPWYSSPVLSAVFCLDAPSSLKTLSPLPTTIPG